MLSQDMTGSLLAVTQSF